MRCPPSAAAVDQPCTFIWAGSEKKREKLSSSVRAVRKGIDSKSPTRLERDRSQQTAPVLLETGPWFGNVSCVLLTL